MVIQFWIALYAACALQHASRQLEDFEFWINPIAKSKGLNPFWVLISLELELSELLRQFVLGVNLAIRYFNQKYQL